MDLFGKEREQLKKRISHLEILNSQLEEFRRRYNKLVPKWNSLVQKINAKGGEQFLEYGELNDFQKPTPQQFTKDEISALIRLCHPDKHGGSKTSTEITVKLLEMRG